MKTIVPSPRHHLRAQSVLENEKNLDQLKKTPRFDPIVNPMRASLEVQPRQSFPIETLEGLLSPRDKDQENSRMTMQGKMELIGTIRTQNNQSVPVDKARLLNSIKPNSSIVWAGQRRHVPSDGRFGGATTARITGGITTKEIQKKLLEMQRSE